MSSHVAISIGATELRAVWLRSGALRWHAQATLPDPQSLNEAVRSLLVTAPPGLAGSRVTVVCSPRWAQAKQLHGLPAVGSMQLVTQLLRENEQAFFLWNGRPSTIVTHAARGRAVWAAAFDTQFLDAVVRAVRSARLRVTEIAPAIAAIALAFPGRSVAWHDGDQAFQLEATHDGLVRLERAFERTNVDAAPIPSLLRPIGVDAEAFLPAYAAASMRRRLPLAWRPSADPARLRRRAHIINAAACAALLGVGAAATLAPGIRAAESARSSERELHRLRVARQELSSVQSELARISQALNVVAAFSADRGRITRTLGVLSEAIPESTAILDVRVDSVEGSFAAIAPNVADVLPALADVHEIAATQIVGSVTRETIAGARLERAAFRFRRSRAKRSRTR